MNNERFHLTDNLPVFKHSAQDEPHAPAFSGRDRISDRNGHLLKKERRQNGKKGESQKKSGQNLEQISHYSFLLEAHQETQSWLPSLILGHASIEWTYKWIFYDTIFLINCQGDRLISAKIKQKNWKIAEYIWFRYNNFTFHSIYGRSQQ